MASGEVTDCEGLGGLSGLPRVRGEPLPAVCYVRVIMPCIPAPNAPHEVTLEWRNMELDHRAWKSLGPRPLRQRLDWTGTGRARIGCNLDILAGDEEAAVPFTEYWTENA